MAHNVRRLTTTGALLVALLGAGALAGPAHAAGGPDRGTDMSPANTIWDRPAPDPQPEPDPAPAPKPDPEPDPAPDNTIWD
ncbi:hypothetical protein [Streptomyces sp. SM12]|uniref:hypothetical protein n=1 Tax=Streptomyces sp. SM12 TaxID=1071602 RepID=UPI0015E1A472|nr:hypothetical protein [Streptomyces sp. SM12]